MKTEDRGGGEGTVHWVASLTKKNNKMKSRRMRWAVHVARTGERRGKYRVLMDKAEGKKPLERSGCRW